MRKKWAKPLEVLPPRIRVTEIVTDPAEIAAADVAIRKRTAKLRAMRLAREAAEHAKPAVAKASPKKKKST